MSELPSKSQKRKALAGDARLSALLRLIQSPEPGPEFQAEVWRRIRKNETMLRNGTRRGRVVP